MGIAAIEDAIIGAVKTRFGRKLRAVDHLPGQWGTDAIRRMAMNCPAVYVAYSGGVRNVKRHRTEDAGFDVYVFTGDGGDERHRRRGSAGNTGAYALLDACLGMLESFEIPDEDALEYQRTDNLFDDYLHENALTGYRLRFTVRRRLPSSDEAAAAVADFLRLATTYDLGVPDGVPEAQDTLDLPPESAP